MSVISSTHPKMSVVPTVATVVLIVLSSNILPSTVNANHHYDEKDRFHSIEKGERKKALEKPTDLLLFHDNVKMDGKLFPFPMTITHDVCYPPKGNKHAKFTITAFDVTDQGKAGWAWIHEGTGIDHNKLCLHFKSQRGKGYHFAINIYGYYN